MRPFFIKFGKQLQLYKLHYLLNYFSSAPIPFKLLQFQAVKNCLIFSSLHFSSLAAIVLFVLNFYIQNLHEEERYGRVDINPNDHHASDANSHSPDAGFPFMSDNAGNNRQNFNNIDRSSKFEEEKDRIFVERLLDAAMFVIYLCLTLSQIGCLNPSWAGKVAESELE